MPGGPMPRSSTGRTTHHPNRKAFFEKGPHPKVSNSASEVLRPSPVPS